MFDPYLLAGCGSNLSCLITDVWVWWIWGILHWELELELYLANCSFLFAFISDENKILFFTS